MKKLLCISLIVLFASQQLSAQVKSDTTRSEQLSDRELGLQYLKKANKQRGTAWALLIGGIALQIVGTSMSLDESGANAGGESMVYIGAMLTIVSFPMFIHGAKNRGRAEILLRHENIMVYNNYGSGKEAVVSLGMSIPIRGSRK